MTTIATTYHDEAAAFVARTNITFRKVYSGHRPYFPGDTEQRAVWDITITREGRRPYTFTFGQSIQQSYQALDLERILPRQIDLTPVMRFKGYKDALAKGGGEIQGRYRLVPVKVEPSDYDVLACLEKGAPGSFEDFCGDYGYDTDSRKALDTFLSVQAQAVAVASLFTPGELRNSPDDLPNLRPRADPRLHGVQGPERRGVDQREETCHV